MSAENEFLTVERPEPKLKFPLKLASPLAMELQKVLRPFCEPDFIVTAGSVRRQRPQVGDIEIMFVPRVDLQPVPDDMFSRPIDVAAKTIDDLVAIRILEPRRNALGHTTWGEWIKLARDRYTGIPVDFFTATKENWFNYLVCRTGPAESNLAICKGARRLGLKWKPYTAGFCQADDPQERICVTVTSEREVFETVRLKFLPPEQR